MYKNTRILLSLLVVAGCSNDFEQANEVNTNNVLFNEVKLQYNVENINDSSHPIFLNFISGNTFDLAINTKYVFNVPITLNNIQNFTLNGNGATLCFPYNGTGIEINSCSNVLVKNLVIDNSDSDGQRYYSLIDKGRIDINSSQFVVLDSVTINEQLHPPTSGENHIQINIYDSTSNEVKNCTVNDSKGELIVIDGSNDCKVINNRTFGGWSGIATKGRILSWYRGYRTTIIDNNVYGTSTASITINDRQSVVENNVISGDSLSLTGGPGIRFGHYQDANGNDYVHLRAKNCTARGNRISNFLTSTPGPGGSSAAGIKIDASVGVDGYGSINVENNIIANCKSGIMVSNAPGQTGQLRDNTIEVDAEGISIFSPDINKLSSFQITGNNITSSGTNFMAGKEHVIRLFRTNAMLNGNMVTLNSTYAYGKGIEIEQNSVDARIDIINNILNVSGNYGIHHTNAEMNLSEIKGNTINSPRIGMLLKSKNSDISNNTIVNAEDYGILLWGDEVNENVENNDIENNFVSVSFSAAIRLHNTKNTRVLANNLDLLAGASLYAVYKSAYNFNPIITSNSHNWPNQHN